MILAPHSIICMCCYSAVSVKIQEGKKKQSRTLMRGEEKGRGPRHTASQITEFLDVLCA